MAEETKGAEAAAADNVEVEAAGPMSIEDLLNSPELMDLYSRQIATYGLSTMTKVLWGTRNHKWHTKHTPMF